MCEFSTHTHRITVHIVMGIGYWQGISEIFDNSPQTIQNLDAELRAAVARDSFGTCFHGIILFEYFCLSFFRFASDANKVRSSCFTKFLTIFDDDKRKTENPQHISHHWMSFIAAVTTVRPRLCCYFFFSIFNENNLWRKCNKSVLNFNINMHSFFTRNSFQVF